MNYELFKSIVDECNHYGQRSYSLHLFGEPLLYPKILDAIHYIKRSNRNNTILLTTNGTVLNRFIDDLARLKVDKIIWSWRAHNFSDNTIRHLKKIGLIRFLLEETPEGEIQKWEGFQKEIKHLHNYGGNIDVKKWGIDSSMDSDRWPCYHLWLAPAVRWNGDFTICCNDPTGRETLGTYGKNNFNIQRAWNSDRIRSLRESQLEGKYKGICVGCNSYRAYPDMFFEFQKKANHGK